MTQACVYHECGPLGLELHGSLDGGLAPATAQAFLRWLCGTRSGLLPPRCRLAQWCGYSRGLLVLVIV